MREHDEHEKLRCHPLVPRCLHGTARSSQLRHFPPSLSRNQAPSSKFVQFYVSTHVGSERAHAQLHVQVKLFDCMMFMFFDEYDYLGAIGETEQKLRVQTRRESC